MPVENLMKTIWWRQLWFTFVSISWMENFAVSTTYNLFGHFLLCCLPTWPDWFYVNGEWDAHKFGVENSGNTVFTLFELIHLWEFIHLQLFWWTCFDKMCAQDLRLTVHEDVNCSLVRELFWRSTQDISCEVSEISMFSLPLNQSILCVKVEVIRTINEYFDWRLHAILSENKLLSSLEFLTSIKSDEIW